MFYVIICTQYVTVWYIKGIIFLLLTIYKQTYFQMKLVIPWLESCWHALDCRQRLCEVSIHQYHIHIKYTNVNRDICTHRKTHMHIHIHICLLLHDEWIERPMTSHWSYVYSFTSVVHRVWGKCIILAIGLLLMKCLTLEWKFDINVK